MKEVFERIEIDSSMCCDEIDFEYEFDAPRFFDFTTPETFFDAFEAEQWFACATSYPPSPFLLKCNMENADAMESENDIAADDDEVLAIDDNNNSVEDNMNSKMKPFSKLTQSISKSSTFMKPTASHLAKQKNATEVQSTHSHRRFPSQNSSIDIPLTKRQKLEAGYLSKAACLHHQTIFRHKKLKEVDLGDNNVTSKSKVTIAKKPNLETASRAQRQRSKANSEPSGDTKSSSKTVKAGSLNKKMLVASTEPSHKKKTPRLTEFNVFNFRTSERAMQHTSSTAGGVWNSNSVSNSETRDIKRTNSSDRSMQEKCRTVNKLRGSSDDKVLSSRVERGVFRNIKVVPLEQNDKRNLNDPPTELLSKLSLASNVKQTTKSQSKKQPVSKGLKENRPGSLHQEHEKMNMIKEGIRILFKKQYKCMNEMESLISKHTPMPELGH